MDAVLDLELNQLTQHAWCPTTNQWVDESNLVKPHEYFCRACQNNFWGGTGSGSIIDHCLLPKHLTKLANYAPQTRAPGEPARKIAKAPAPLPQILAVQSRSRSPIRRQELLGKAPQTTSKSSPYPRLQPIAFVAETETAKVSIPQPPPPPVRSDPIRVPPFMQPPSEPHPQEQAALPKPQFPPSPWMPREHIAEDTAIVQYRPRPSRAPELHEWPDNGEGMYSVLGDEPPRRPTWTNPYQMLPALPQFQHPMSSYRHRVSPITQPPMQTSGPQIVYVPMLLQMQPQPMSTHSGLQVLPLFPDF